jgi:hypothetical protein
MTLKFWSRSSGFVVLLGLVGAACSSGSPAGGSGSGGNSGSGGMNVNCINSPADLISDFTNGDTGVKPLDMREGGFYTYGDDSERSGMPLAILDPAEGSSATTDDSVGGECSGAGSFRVKATGFKIWGAATGTNFGPGAGKSSTGMNLKGFYDASKYKGISFWAKASSEVNGIQVSFPDSYTDGYADPTMFDKNPDVLMCTYGASQTNCSPFLVKFGNPDYPKYMDKKFDTTWRRFDVMFEDAQQDKDNKPGYLLTTIGHVDLKHLTAFAVQVNAIHNMDGTVTANDFEIWLDDIYFIK